MSDAMSTTDKRDRLAELVRERDRLEAWLKSNAVPRAGPPYTDAAYHETCRRYRQVWIECANAILDMREQFATERDLIPTDLHAGQLDERWGLMSGVLRGRETWGRAFTLHTLRYGTRARQRPSAARRERDTYTWRDCFRSLAPAKNAPGADYAVPAVIVAHCIDPASFERLAAEHELCTERLAWSWLDPLNRTAVAATLHGLPSVDRRAARADDPRPRLARA